MRRTVDAAPEMIDWLLDRGLVPLADHPVTGDAVGRKAYEVPRYLWAQDAGRAILAVTVASSRRKSRAVASRSSGRASAAWSSMRPGPCTACARRSTAASSSSTAATC
ncbi:MAG: hypothetical protein U1F11_05320 [Steroidobacteraceae bacterium]